MELIKTIETRFPVNHWLINSVQVWPILRIQIMFQLIEKHTKIEKGVPSSQFMLSNILPFTQALISKKENINSLSTYDTMFLSDISRKILLKDKWFDRIADPVRDILLKKNMTSVSLELGNKYKPSEKNSVYIQNNINNLKLRSKILHKNKSYDMQLGQYDLFLRFLSKNKLSTFFFRYENLKNIVYKLILYKHFFEKKIKLYKPKLVFIVCYYSIEGMSLVQACKENNIPTIDLQHGVQGELHLAYGSWHNVPKYGYDLLPKYFWCWDKSEQNAIKQWQSHVKDNHIPIVGGNVFLQMWGKKDNEIVSYYDNKINELVSQKKDTLLLTLSPKFSEKNHLHETLLALRELQGIFNIFIRLHPRMLSEIKAYTKLLENYSVKDYWIKEPTDYPLYSILRNTKVHISQVSSCLIEAASFGVPSIMTDPLSTKIFKEYFKQKTAFYADNKTDIIRLVNISSNKHQKRETHNSFLAEDVILKLISSL
jgi:hypothetical protein